MPERDESKWRDRWAAAIAARALPEIGRLVAVSTPSGDARAAEEIVGVVADMLPSAAAVERIPCSSPAHAPDLVARLTGEGEGRLLLVGHLDTVVAHDAHLATHRDGDSLIGSGTIDMKGGVALSLGVMRALAEEPGRYAEVALLLVNDEEFRTEPFAHGTRFADFDACLCFEGGERTADGDEAVVVRRKAAAAIRVDATGIAAHAGANPDAGRNALLALASVATTVAGRHDPDGPESLSVVPTMIGSGEGINVVPGAGELMIDMRADDAAGFEPVIASVPERIDGVRLAVERLRLWPGMDMAAAAEAPLRRATELLGRPIVGAARGGASDASNLAPHVPLAIDGLGPLGGAAHSPAEHLLVDSLGDRAAVALAIAAAVLAG
ncbi:MAG TPA: M20/M25/M40 family metallo-hydrolase [Solirubrobacterales bacterium]|nr:M20/M25/M40 family metallo-hydrolase [Solirubrobacterales bacterium]